MREQVRAELLQALGSSQYPLTATAAKRLLDARRVRPCGWDTVVKYLEELATQRLVLRQPLPTERGRKPMVVYMGRVAKTSSGGEFLGRSSTG
jgi:hypothetical protein